MSKSIEDFFGEVDAARALRARELSEVKRLLSSKSRSDPMGIQSKALVVLSYAIWEGFYNECIDSYCDFLQAREKRVSDVGWRLLVGALHGEFESLRNRNHSAPARRDFVERLQVKLSCGFSEFERKTIYSRSNLDWDRLKQNFDVLGFDDKPLQRYRMKLNKEVVGWRHAAAHGAAPSLEELDATEHISLVSDLLMLVSDAFQSAALRHA